MAQIAPDLLPGEPLSPERQTLAALKVGLPDAYTVFHGVHWSREDRRYAIFGEIDFAIVNRAGRVLLIEQKNGPLAETATGLVKAYPDGERHVGDQLRRNLEGIRHKFQSVHRGTSLDVDYLLYCPDHRVRELNAAALDASRIVDAASARGLARRVEAVLGPGASGQEAWAKTVRKFFRQTLKLVPDIHAHVARQEGHFLRLAGGLVEFLAGLEIDPYRLRISGTAGCGKTMIARHAYDLALERGRRPLLVCFNRPLAERLRNRSPVPVMARYGLPPARRPSSPRPRPLASVRVSAGAPSASSHSVARVCPCRSARSIAGTSVP